MRFRYATDYALRVLMYLGARPGELCKTREIAERCAISEAHLAKVVHQLGALGVITTARGRHGGIALTREPAEIGLGDIVRKTEAERAAVVECFAPETNTCPLAPSCVLKRALAEALAAFHASLDRYTLADLLGPPSAVHRLVTLRARPSRAW